jgi:hypothetical protein
MARSCRPLGSGRIMRGMRLTEGSFGREVLVEEEASPNYRLRQVRRRRTGDLTWEVVEAATAVAVVTGLPDREEALRIVRGWERLSQKIEGGLSGHVVVH